MKDKQYLSRTVIKNRMPESDVVIEKKLQYVEALAKSINT